MGAPRTVDCGQEDLARGEVEARGRLVQQEQGWCTHEGAGDQRAPALALRERGPHGVRVPRHAQRVDEFVGAGTLLAGRRPAGRELGGVRQAGDHHIAHAERRVQAVPRVDVPDVRAQLAHVHPAQALAQHVDGAVGRVGDRAAQAEQRRLPGPVRAQQHPVFAAPHGERDVIEQLAPVADEVHVVDAQHVRVLGGCAHYPFPSLKLIG
ncbi:hypothetical protein MTP03_05360 [Tsukamurella sp. PLM1]|nr:hypothetical protein MTP03_05360 [Tsukamurella sp. PLM1]